MFADEDALNEILWCLSDRQGAIRDWAEYDELADTTTVANHVVFDGFGKITSQTYPNQEDPIGFAGGDVNLSRYVGNGAPNWTDSSGLSPFMGLILAPLAVPGAIIGAGAAAAGGAYYGSSSVSEWYWAPKTGPDPDFPPIPRPNPNPFAPPNEILSPTCSIPVPSLVDEGDVPPSTSATENPAADEPVPEPPDPAPEAEQEPGEPMPDGPIPDEPGPRDPVNHQNGNDLPSGDDLNEQQEAVREFNLNSKFRNWWHKNISKNKELGEAAGGIRICPLTTFSTATKNGKASADQGRNKMYSVIRFSEIQNPMDLQRIGMSVNDIVPGLFTGPDRSQSQFSCSITDTDDWRLHCDLIKELLSELSPVIKEVVASGIDVEVDIAIDPEDYMDRWLTEFPLEKSLLSAIVTSGVTLRMSMYGNKEVGNTLPD